MEFLPKVKKWQKNILFFVLATAHKGFFYFLSRLFIRFAELLRLLKQR